jgi:chromosome partitioning protein
MATIAVYNGKGGVGKTSTAVNLAWAAAHASARRTLLWDLDAQGAAGFLLGNDGGAPRGSIEGLFDGTVKPKDLIQSTPFDRIDLLPADPAMASLDRHLHELDRKKQLAKMVEDLSKRYDIILLDCPPGIGELAEQIVRAADIVVVPVVPGALSRRTLASVDAFVNAKNARAVPLLPVHAMVDRRKKLHRDAVAADGWPTLPQASVVEQMAERRAPVGKFAPRTAAAEAYASLWRKIAADVGC